MNTFIIVERFYSFTTGIVLIGGVESYVANLIEVLNGLDFSCVILQRGKDDRIAILPSCEVHQYKAENIKDLIEYACEKEVDKENDLVIFGTDTILCETLHIKKSIAIQHGIWWDMPNSELKGKLERIFPWFSREFFLRRLLKSETKRAFHLINRLNSVSKVVCVDYNFVNWYRSLVHKNRVELLVIPNYARISEINEKPNDKINIIFARRLVWYRGTRVFASVISRILDKYADIYVTIAGTGPDEGLLHQQLDKYNNVEFISYKSSESRLIHSDKHIAIIPTIGSEGTSLSLLEAMSAQCAVVCSDVGGMTSIVLDGFNGKVVQAGNEDDLYDAIVYYLENPDERLRLANCGYETVKRSFSHKKWADAWKRVILDTVSSR